MSRASADYEFVTTNSQEIESQIASIYTAITGRTATAGPDRLFIQVISAIVLLCNVNINKAGNQNLPSRAEGVNLDAVAQLYFEKTRPTAQAAGVMMEFTISEAQDAPVVIPVGTRVSVDNGEIVFTTDSEVAIAPGETSKEVHATCVTTGTVGNGFKPGEIKTCVDPFPYYESCRNTDESDGGGDDADDEEFYQLLVASQDAYSSAGPIGAYAYFAKTVSQSIADVYVNSPLPGYVYIYVIMDDGKPAGEEIKSRVLATCSDDQLRPLTDHVVMHDPDIVNFDIDIKYYIPSGSGESAETISAAVQKAVNEYVKWQCSKMGRDIIPSKLIQLVMMAGAKRVEVTSPVYTVLRDGNAREEEPLENKIPQLAQVGSINLVNGGYEDE